MEKREFTHHQCSASNDEATNNCFLRHADAAVSADGARRNEAQVESFAFTSLEAEMRFHTGSRSGGSKSRGMGSICSCWCGAVDSPDISISIGFSNGFV